MNPKPKPPLTAEEQRIAIAEACGWKQHPQEPCVMLHKEHSWKLIIDLPDYLNDLNAIHEAEKVLNEKQSVWYLQKLTQVRFKAGVSGMIGCMIDKTVFATASQRAEAFLRTIGKWKE